MSFCGQEVMAWSQRTRLHWENSETPREGPPGSCLAPAQREGVLFLTHPGQTPCPGSSYRSAARPHLSRLGAVPEAQSGPGCCVSCPVSCIRRFGTRLQERTSSSARTAGTGREGRCRRSQLGPWAGFDILGLRSGHAAWYLALAKLLVVPPREADLGAWETQPSCERWDRYPERRPSLHPWMLSRAG